ncbi:MAG: hypothetical protein SVR81_05010 [Chloroflexota bacterium]|nr:hypothetical protein [Chloroflexota bacterium]
MDEDQEKQACQQPSASRDQRYTPELDRREQKGAQSRTASQ